MSRWKFRTGVATAGENTQEVRQLTAGERAKFAQTSKQIKANELEANDLPFLIVSWGAVNPTTTAEAARDMPPDLLDACVAKILELSGIRDADDDEKKTMTTDPQSSPPTN